MRTRHIATDDKLLTKIASFARATGTYFSCLESAESRPIYLGLCQQVSRYSNVRECLTALRLPHTNALSQNVWSSREFSPQGLSLLREFLVESV